MKNSKFRSSVLTFIVCFIVGMPAQIPAQSCPGQELRLEGLELAKGVNLTSTFRVGTLFAGEVFCEDSRIGRWTALLSHKGTENIEVCGGTGDIVTMRLSINFFSGHQLVLGMVDLSGEDDVFWDYAYAPPPSLPCSLLGGLDCEACGDTTLSACTTDYSDVAEIHEIRLRPRSGSTINIEDAILSDGRLCHYYPLIPRVSARLTINK